MTSRRPLLLLSIPVLALVAIGLVVAHDSTGVAGYQWGAIGVLAALVLVGIAVAGRPRSLAGVESDAARPSSDDIERVMTQNVSSVSAASLVGSAPRPEPSPQPSPNAALVPPPVPHPFVPLVEPTPARLDATEPNKPVMGSPATELFVNLGRRNKQLNRQMLTLISHLQRDGIASDTWEGLSELDRLAMRMKRNEDNLLMLSSTRRARQWSPPIPLETVFASSIAEVERGDRVVIDDVPELEVVGSVAVDLAHLIAELVDNATEFSHNSTVATISAQSTLEGLEIEVFDAGHGMEADKLDALNALLTDPPDVGDAPSRRLGLFIAGHLARGLDIKVELTGQRGVGTVATVSLPNDLLIEQLETAPDAGQDELGAIDLVDPVMQVLVSSELAEVDEEELAMASLPTEAEVAEALATFPSVEILDPEPQASTEASHFPSIADIADLGVVTEPLAPMPLPEVSPVSALSDFDDDAAHGVAQGVAASVAAFSAGVARGLADAEEELSTEHDED